MKIGIELKIDVLKIDKARLYQGKKGNYLSLTTFIDTENTSQYGDHGVITQSKNKDENIQLPIIGNAKIFWRDDNTSQQPEKEPEAQKTGGYDATQEIPF